MLKLFAVVFSLFISIAHADTICTGSVPNTFTPGTIISSSQMNANFAYYSSCINTNAAKNGVNSSITALLGLTTPIDPGVGGSPIYNATSVGGTADDITVTATRTAISAFTYTAGNIVTLVATGTNTTAATINVNSLGVKNILKYSFSGLVALTGGEITSGNPAFLYYDGTQFVLINIPPTLGAVTTLASASTTDLGTIASHNVNVTGTTTITSFGSSASTAQPYYYIRSTDALTITFNATSMITPDGLDVLVGANDVVETVYLGSGNWRIYTHKIAIPTTPTIQRFTSGSGTYTAPTGTTYVEIEIVGGGGGGGALVTNAGTTGGTTSFESWTVVGGSGGGPSTPGGLGGTGGATGTGTLISRVSGSDGDPGHVASGVGSSGKGGNSCLTGAAGGRATTGTGLAAKTNSGSGGSGGLQTGSADGGGGGAGECAKFIMLSSAASGASYTVGALGAGGAAGTQAGGDGGAGLIVVKEFYTGRK